jgi:hypothetical protein
MSFPELWILALVGFAGVVAFLAVFQTGWWLIERLAAYIVNRHVALAVHITLGLAWIVTCLAGVLWIAYRLDQ